MKVVVLNGSPLKKGLTAQLTDYIFETIDCEIKTYYAYYTDIKSCVACKYCFSHPNECVIKDEFQTMMKDFDEADLVVLASPLHFSSFTGELLSTISRLQYLFGLKYVHKLPIPFKNKKGLTIITGGNDYPTMFNAIKNVDSLIYNHINVKEYDRVLVKATDKYSMEEIKVQYAEDIERVREFINKSL
ncbi:multimeric flavodoxin WrbA [Bacilli bacterium PM5-3]|nr:multimeric flavodoxin WrbA [Bacilli bacterium PM5-3]MDH6603787.1 multimeric flavodoxin WrbA [Bacilli bacterium PM5-9]